MKLTNYDKAKKRMVLENDYHNTEVTVLVPAAVADTGSQREAWLWLQEETQRSYYADDNRAAKRRLRRVQNALCGCHDCQCGVVRP